MENMIKALQVSGIILLVLFLSPPIFAHPGNTAADGCHYCRTNCDRWGVPWNQRHCHNGSSVQEPPVYIPTAEPTNTPIPWPTWTPKPLPTSTSAPTLTAIPTEIPSSTPVPTENVLGAEVEPSPTAAVQSNTGSSVGELLTLLLMGGGGWYLLKRRQQKQPPTQNPQV